MKIGWPCSENINKHTNRIYFLVFINAEQFQTILHFMNDDDEQNIYDDQYIYYFLWWWNYLYDDYSYNQRTLK